MVRASGAGSQDAWVLAQLWEGTGSDGSEQQGLRAGTLAF